MDNWKLLVNELEIKDEIAYKDAPVLKFSIKYPKLSGDRFQFFIERLNWHYCNKAHALERYCRGRLYEAGISHFNKTTPCGYPFYEFEFSFTFKVTYNERGLLSLYFEQYQFEGGANGTVRRYSDNWNLQTRREIRLGDLLSSNTNYMEYVKDEIKKQITEKMESSPGYYFDDFNKLVPKYFNPKNFYMTRGAIVVYFQEVEIAPHSSSIAEFKIPVEGKYPASHSNSFGSDSSLILPQNLSQ